MENNRIRYSAFYKDDYDQTIRIGKKKFLCYSSKLMGDLYPENNYKVIGVAAENKQKNNFATIRNPDFAGYELKVFRSDQFKYLLYKKAGFVAVNEGRDDEYVILLTSRLPFLALLLALLIAIAAVLYFAFFYKPPIADYVPPVIDPNAQAILASEDQPKKSGGSNNSVSMIYKNTATISLSDKKVSLFFRNPSESTHSVMLKLAIADGDNEIDIASSGLIKPGYGIYDMDYMSEQAVLRDGDYEARLYVIYYKLETNEREIITSKIDLTATVKS